MRLNRFKKIELSEEQQQVLQDEVEEKVDESSDFLKTFFSVKGFSSEKAVAAIPFITFLAFLGMVYIGNRHYAENTVREIDALGKEVKYLSWEYKSLKADLMLKSTQSEVAKKVDTLGLKILASPPTKIVLNTKGKQK